MGERGGGKAKGEQAIEREEEEEEDEEDEDEEEEEERKWGGGECIERDDGCLSSVLVKK